jgi:hypothetical protein
VITVSPNPDIHADPIEFTIFANTEELMSYQAVVTQTVPGCPWYCAVTSSNAGFNYVSIISLETSIFFYRPNEYQHGVTGTYTLTCQSTEQANTTPPGVLNLNVHVTHECAAINPASYTPFSVQVGSNQAAPIAPAVPVSNVNCTQPIENEIAMPLPPGLESTDVSLDATKTMV